MEPLPVIKIRCPHCKALEPMLININIVEDENGRIGVKCLRNFGRWN